jgi:hypothetical protein
MAARVIFILPIHYSYFVEATTNTVEKGKNQPLKLAAKALS